MRDPIDDLEIQSLCADVARLEEDMAVAQQAICDLVEMLRFLMAWHGAMHQKTGLRQNAQRLQLEAAEADLQLQQDAMRRFLRQAVES